MILKENGYDVVNVGKTISFDSILQCIDKIKPDLLFTTFILLVKKLLYYNNFVMMLILDPIASFSYGGNPDLLRLVNTHGKVFYSLQEFDKFFTNKSLN